MATELDRQTVNEAAKTCVPFSDYDIPDSFIRRLRNAKLVFLGDASHGTHEFYQWRASLSERLIRELGFNFIAVEGEWPACQRLSKYLTRKHDENLERVFAESFANWPWPKWMWANREIAALAERIREINKTRDEKTAGRPVGLHGLDVYSLFESLTQTVAHLAPFNVNLAARAHQAYECFRRFNDSTDLYIRALSRGEPSCKNAAQEVYAELDFIPRRHDAFAQESLFEARQNARVVLNAERYYRSLVDGDDSWGIRDHHMFQTLQSLIEYYGEESKGIIWAHVNHVGNYLKEGVSSPGYVNVGGLARQVYGDKHVVSIGSGTYEGYVTAAAHWGAPPLRARVPPARPGSYEALFHEVAKRLGIDRFLLLFDDTTQARETAEYGNGLKTRRPHRFFTVSFNPKVETDGIYIRTSLSNWYDAYVFFDKSQALNLFQAQGHPQKRHERPSPEQTTR